jgi:hypothetical protein
MASKYSPASGYSSPASGYPAPSYNANANPYGEAEPYKKLKFLVAHTWEIGLLFIILVACMVVFEKGMHLIEHKIEHHPVPQRGLKKALKKMKDELLVTGFLSLLLTALQVRAPVARVFFAYSRPVANERRLKLAIASGAIEQHLRQQEVEERPRDSRPGPVQASVRLRHHPLRPHPALLRRGRQHLPRRAVACLGHHAGAHPCPATDASALGQHRMLQCAACGATWTHKHLASPRTVP